MCNENSRALKLHQSLESSTGMHLINMEDILVGAQFESQRSYWAGA
jgi:hypothetical protein